MRAPLAFISRPFLAVALVVASAPVVAAQATQAAQPDHQAHAAAAPLMPRDEIVAFAKVQVAVAQARDSAQARLASPRNTKVEPQGAIRDSLNIKIADILHHAGMTDADFKKKTYIVSSDAPSRKIFDSVVAQVSGIPTPGQVPATAAAAPAVKVPAGAVGTHIGHVVNGFGDTPGGQGLLPVALAEARVAIQHAQLASRAPTNLDGMKLHAGHVINAMDPTIVTAGPGLGYGMKRAALGVATHIELAAKADGASPNVVAHSMHVATAARAAAARGDAVIALAQKIQAATTAEEAAGLLNQLVSLTQQLVAGVDANADGRINWDAAEGGLQQAQEHVNLLLAGEKLPPF